MRQGWSERWLIALRSRRPDTTIAPAIPSVWEAGRRVSSQGDRQSPAVELTHGADCSGSTRRGLRGWCVGTTDRKVTHLLG